MCFSVLWKLVNPARLGGDRGGGKKGGKRGKEGVKNTPRPQSGLLRGTRLGSSQKNSPGEEKFHSSLGLGGQIPSLAATPTGSTGICVPVLDPVNDCPPCEDSILLPSFSGQLREADALPPAM